MKCLLLLIILGVSFISNSQISATSNLKTAPNTGIKWSEGLSWEQVKAKAKQENKYIFLDIFATWCGPCKLMDKEVYPNETVGDYFNQHFISVKVQTDKSKNDNEHVRSWYNDAEFINKQFMVEGYPCFVFLSPQGVVVEKQMGYKAVSDLIATAEISTRPGKVYNDTYSEYKHLVADYKKDIKRYDRMPFMITTASNLGEVDFGFQVLKEYTNYCLTLAPKHRYTKENIEMWNGLQLSSKTRAFEFFYRDGDLIDKVMNKKGFAEIWVCRIIEDEIVWPFLKEQSRGEIGPGMVVSGPGLKVDTREADWGKLYRIIRKEYKASYAKRNVLDARIQWYMRNNNLSSQAKYQFLKFEKYPESLTDKGVNGIINSIAWDIFLHSTDQAQIEKTIYWQKKALKITTDNYPDKQWSAGMDTYANLLYKAGRVAEAIQWQEKAINGQPSISKKEEFMKVAEKMRKGEPTYLEQGAIWVKK